MAHLRSGEMVLTAPTQVELGMLQQQNEGRADFTLINVSRYDVEIQKVETGCSCTLAAIGDRTITPGASTSLLITMKTHSHRGRITEMVDLWYRQSGEDILRKLELGISGYVQPHYEIRPFDHLVSDKCASLDLVICTELFQCKLNSDFTACVPGDPVLGADGKPVRSLVEGFGYVTCREE